MAVGAALPEYSDSEGPGLLSAATGRLRITLADISTVSLHAPFGVAPEEAVVLYRPLHVKFPTGTIPGCSLLTRHDKRFPTR